MDAGQANPDGWLPAAGIKTAGDPIHKTPFRDIYITAFYWAITVLSTVGFGDVTPRTWKEKLFAIVAELFGCLLFATLIGGLGGIFGASPLSAPS